jgi:hypothetical protein
MGENDPQRDEGIRNIEKFAEIDSFPLPAHFLK